MSLFTLTLNFKYVQTNLGFRMCFTQLKKRDKVLEKWILDLGHSSVYLGSISALDASLFDYPANTIHKGQM